jgi:hypothetical protein
MITEGSIPEQILQRGDKVDFIGNQHYRSVKGTYIWWTDLHLSLYLYVIEHPDGHAKDHFVSKHKSMDGFESVPRKCLDDNKRYIYAEPNKIKLS